MSDLITGRSAATGHGRVGSNCARSQPPPVTTGSPSCIKGPREVMRERNAREARRKLEQEQKEAWERSRADEETILREERRYSTERRTSAAAGAAGRPKESGERPARNSAGTSSQKITEDPPAERDRRSGDKAASTRTQDQPLPSVGRVRRPSGGDDAAAVRPRPRQSQNQPRPVQTDSSRRPAQAEASIPAPTASSTQPGTAPTAVRSAFPHAFERWETLSAHWEGLTSFWIRRLEENSHEINRDPLSQQLSRQVTDLSAAGANLFHAVVELQRLRASSERKFQRWFFETRSEQERNQEIQAMTLKELEAERQGRAAAIAEAVTKERQQSNIEKQLTEMKRELQISKEEARRAWEELGRREQEERQRTSSLRDGLPTVVGGVQVVPMIAGAPSRRDSTRENIQTHSAAASRAQAQEGEAGPDTRDAYDQENALNQRESTDPFIESPGALRTPAAGTKSFSDPSIQDHPAFTNAHSPSQAPAVQPASTTFYQQNEGTFLHPTEAESYIASEATFSEDEYEVDSHGRFIRDAAGHKIRYEGPPTDDGSEDLDAAEEREREIANFARYGHTSAVKYVTGIAATSAAYIPGTSAPNPTIGEPVDYSGQGYGSGPEWAGVPRHHHPTRLSDVMEEDERSRTSRTSASQVSRSRE